MPANVLDEDKWEKAKQSAKDQGRAEDWPYVMGIYKKMGGRFKNGESFVSSEYNQEAPFLTLNPGMQVRKGARYGQVISVTPDDAIIMWRDGTMTKEPSDKIFPCTQPNPATEYLRRARLI